MLKKYVTLYYPRFFRFLTRLMDFMTPNLDALALPMETAYPPGVSPLYPQLPTGNESFPLSAAYLRLLGRKNGSVGPGHMPSLAWTSKLWQHAWAAATLLAGLLPHLSLYPSVSFGSIACLILADVF